MYLRLLSGCAGTVKSTKMNRTIIVRRNYVHFIKKYGRYCHHLLVAVKEALGSVSHPVSLLSILVALHRYEKRHGNVAAHISPAFRASDGDTVIIGQCRCSLCARVRVWVCVGVCVRVYVCVRARAGNAPSILL